MQRDRDRSRFLDYTHEQLADVVHKVGNAEALLANALELFPRRVLVEKFPLDSLCLLARSAASALLVSREADTVVSLCESMLRLLAIEEFLPRLALSDIPRCKTVGFCDDTYQDEKALALGRSRRNH